jgi:hypothetical protein
MFNANSYNCVIIHNVNDAVSRELNTTHFSIAPPTSVPPTSQLDTPKPIQHRNQPTSNVTVMSLYKLLVGSHLFGQTHYSMDAFHSKSFQHQFSMHEPKFLRPALQANTTSLVVQYGAGRAPKYMYTVSYSYNSSYELQEAVKCGRSKWTVDCGSTGRFICRFMQ